MPSNLYNFSILSLNMLDEERLRQSVLACAPALGLEFVFSTAMQSEALFLAKDSAFAHIMLNKAKNDEMLSLFFVESASNQNEPNDSSFQDWPCVSVNIEPSDLALILKIHLKQQGFSPKQEITPVSQYSFATLADLTEQLNELIIQRVQYFSITNGERTIFLNLEKNVFFFDSEKHYDFDQSNASIHKLLAHFKAGGSISVLTEETCNLPTKYYTYMAHRLLWLLAEQMSEQLLKGIDKDSTFGITHWPDFGSLKTDSSYLRVCANLIQKPLTLYEIKNKLNLSKAKVIAFLNSSMLCQHLIYGTDLESTKKNTVASLSREEILNCRRSLNIENGK